MKIASITPCSAVVPSNNSASLSHHLLPFYSSKVQAGFPSPADDYISGSLDLNNHLIKHPASTFFVRVTGNSMIDAGIRDNDLLIVDESLEATNNKIVIATVAGEFTVKRLKLNAAGDSYLMPENKDFSPIRLCEDSQVWGVVTTVIHAL